MMGIMWGSLSATDQGAGQVDPRSVRLDGQANDEVAVIFIEFEFSRRRAVFPHRADDLGDASGTAFGKFQFLEKLANAAIPITARDGFARAELLKTDRTVRTGIADHDQFIPRNADFDRLTHFVAAVIDCVHDGFFDGGVRESFPPAWLRPGHGA